MIFVKMNGAVQRPKGKQVNRNSFSRKTNLSNFLLQFDTGIKKYASLRSIVLMKHPGVRSLIAVRISSILKCEVSIVLFNPLRFNINLFEPSGFGIISAHSDLDQTCVDTERFCFFYGYNARYFDLA